MYFLYRDVPAYDAIVSSDSTVESVPDTLAKPEATTLSKPDSLAKPDTTRSNPVETKPVETKPVEAKPVVEKAVEVPDGPFAVKNSETGRTCYIGQSQDKAIYMESNGKTLWTVPFSGKICGRVAAIDYFENGKLQYLMISGKKMYLYDRLGKIVRTFPKTLSKEVLLGPDAYDFNGNKVYNIIVLNKDNTIDMYNMKGEKPAQWKTISPKAAILALPSLVKISGRSYWVVRTALQTVVYPFYGGEYVKAFDGDVEIKPTTKLN